MQLFFVEFWNSSACSRITSSHWTEPFVYTVTRWTGIRIWKRTWKLKWTISKYSPSNFSEELTIFAGRNWTCSQLWCTIFHHNVVDFTAIFIWDPLPFLCAIWQMFHLERVKIVSISLGFSLKQYWIHFEFHTILDLLYGVQHWKCYVDAFYITGVMILYRYDILHNVTGVST